MNPIKKLPKIIKTERLEMRQLDVTPENAQLVFDAVKDENPDDFRFGPICESANVPRSADEMYQQMRRDQRWCAVNGVEFYIFLDGRMIGYRRIHFFDDMSKTLQSSHAWLVRSAWGQGFASETYRALEQIAFETLGARRITRQCDTRNVRSANSIRAAGFQMYGIRHGGGMYPNGERYDNMLWVKEPPAGAGITFADVLETQN